MNSRQSILDASRTLPTKAQNVTQSLVSPTLTPEQYRRLEEEFPPRITDNPTFAAIQLGQQQVLRALRISFVSN